MRVSVITVCRNASATIADALCSVAEQDYPDLEHVVIDGGSTDGTQELVRRHARTGATVVSEPDAGIYDAMNKGLRVATGTHACFLNADDFYRDRSVISRLLAAIDSASAEAVHADLCYVDRRDVGRVVRRWRGREFAPGAFARAWAPAHPTFMARTDILRDLGGFDTRYRLAADFDLMLRALEVRRIKSTYVPLDAVRMRTGGATNRSLGGICRQNAEILDSLRRHGMATSAVGFLTRKAIARLRQRLDMTERSPQR
jgi:glycosyltransferase involved in cell wall biosynthesis